jgi:hypothetical protein
MQKTKRKRMRENKHYFNQKKAGEALLLSDKTDFLG